MRSSEDNASEASTFDYRMSSQNRVIHNGKGLTTGKVLGLYRIAYNLASGVVQFSIVSWE